MQIADNCLPRIIAVDGSCGCSLTRASILGMTPQEFENQGFKEVGMDRLIATSQEAKVAGYNENTMEMLLMGRLAPIKGAITKTNIGASGSVILPYIYRRQKRNINSNYWVVENGAQNPNHGIGNMPDSAWDLTVVNSVSPYASSLKNLEQYFLPGKYLIVETVDAATKAAKSLQFKIIAAANADAGGVSKALITVEPNYSSAGWAGLAAGDKAAYQITTGTAFVLANSVSDYESWCYNEVAENANKLLTFWLQTSRETHCFNDEYLRALNAALTSRYFKDFRQLPLAEQKRIKHKKYMQSWLNSVFYGQRINENQALETYTDLPQVVDPANPSCVIEYKANALGFKTQLQDCGRYLDHQGNALSVDFLAATGYDMKRAREADGTTVDTIDWMTDRFTAGHIFDLMVSFYKAKGISIERHIEQNVPLKFDNQVMLTYNTYQLPPDLGGYNFAVFTHPFFDDRISAASGVDQKNRQRTMWGIDWSDVVIGIAGTNSAQRQTNVADDLYNCVIRPNVNHYQLMSTLWTSILEDPSRHYIVDNFNDSCPNLSFTQCTV